MSWKELGVLNGIQSDRHWQVIWLVTYSTYYPTMPSYSCFWWLAKETFMSLRLTKEY